MENKIVLSKAITVNGKKITELAMGEATIGMLEGAELFVTENGEFKIDLKTLPVLIANVCKIPVTSAKSISIKDMPKIMAFASDFLGFSPETGK